MRVEKARLFSCSDCATALSSSPITTPASATVVAFANFSGTPKGTLALQGSADGGSNWATLASLTEAAAAEDGFMVVNVSNYRTLRGVYTPTAQKQISTFTLGGALVALNVVHCIINGTEYTATYAASSDATLQALATAVAADPNVSSAVVTVVGGSQVGTDDRVLTITGIDNTVLTITGSVTAGAGQASVTIAQTQASSSGSLDLDLAILS